MTSRAVSQAVLATAFIFPSLLPAGAMRKPAPPDPAADARRGAALAESGQCQKALALLIKATPQVADKDKKRNAGFAGVRCAMALNHGGGGLLDGPMRSPFFSSLRQLCS